VIKEKPIYIYISVPVPKFDKLIWSSYMTRHHRSNYNPSFKKHNEDNMEDMTLHRVLRDKLQTLSLLASAMNV